MVELLDLFAMGLVASMHILFPEAVEFLCYMDGEPVNILSSVQKMFLFLLCSHRPLFASLVYVIKSCTSHCLYHLLFYMPLR